MRLIFLKKNALKETEIITITNNIPVHNFVMKSGNGIWLYSLSKINGPHGSERRRLVMWIKNTTIMILAFMQCRSLAFLYDLKVLANFFVLNPINEVMKNHVNVVKPKALPKIQNSPPNSSKWCKQLPDWFKLTRIKGITIETSKTIASNIMKIPNLNFFWEGLTSLFWALTVRSNTS